MATKTGAGARLPQRRATAAGLAHEVLDAIDRHDLNALPQLYAPGARIEDPGGARFVGGEQLKAHLERLIQAVPDIRHEVSHTIEMEGAAAVQGRITGTQTGPLALPGKTIPPSGRAIDLRFAFLVRATEGQITFDDLYFDRADLLQQLGLT